MNPAIAGKGSSFKGAIGYITHDIGRDTAERVAFTGTLNLRTNDPEKAAKVMAWTAMHASEIKRAAGLPPTGRKTVDPVYHFALTWEPSQDPSKNEMVEAAVSALAHLGYEGHEAVYAVHRDKDHAHIHVVVNRVNPQTGRTVNPDNDYERMQRWGWEYEKAHGHIFCLDRALRFERDPQQRAELERRRAVLIERGEHQPSRPRPQWEAEREVPYPSSRSAQEIRAELGTQAKALHAEGRAQTERQRSERAELWQAFQDQKRALWKEQQTDSRADWAAAVKRELAPMERAQRAERTAQWESHQQEWRDVSLQDRAAERRAVDRLFRAQRGEYRAFLRSSHREGWVGALATAVQAMRAAPVEPDQKGARGLLANLARFAAVALSADRRAALFLAGQKNEREQLRAQIQRQQAPKRQRAQAALKTRHAAERQATREAQRTQRDEVQEVLRQAPATAQRAEATRALYATKRTQLTQLYMAAKSTLLGRHAEERAALRARWTAHDAERRAAWGRYRAGREEHALPARSKPPAEQSRSLKAKQASRAFGDVGRQADGRAASRARQADAGRAAPTTPATARGAGRSRGLN